MFSGIWPPPAVALPPGLRLAGGTGGILALDMAVFLWLPPL
jgi:hypothetical protein